MNGYRAIVGLCMLCALLVSAFAAQSASAVGTTAHTCVNSGTPTEGKDRFSDAHCKTIDNTTPGAFRHVEIKNNTTTPAKLTNETTGGAKQQGILHAVINGVLTELAFSEAESTTGAWLENKEEGGEMFVQGEGKIIFKGVTVLKPANCKVVSLPTPGVVGQVETNQLKVTTKGQGDNVQLTPAAGTVFAEFAIEDNGGVCAAKLEPVKVIGSFKGQPEGATTKFNPTTITTEGTLRIGSAAGPKAGLSGSATIKAGATEGATNPIAATT